MLVLIPVDRAAADDPIRQVLDRRLPWLAHGELFSGQLFGTGPWPVQGWKLHVSATPLSAVEVLGRALPPLLTAGARFKVVNTVDRLLALNAGMHGASQVGKFITIYPTDDTQAVALARELDAATGGLAGPRVPSDRCLRPGSLVHYRYGAMQARSAPEPGAEGYDLLDPEGRLTHDSRRQFYVPPPGQVKDPFEAAGIYEPPPTRAGALGGRFLVTDVLARTYRGGVFKAIDLTAQPPCVCLLKEYWHDVGTDHYGRDVRAWGENEVMLLSRHEVDPLLPRLHGSFEQDGNLYVAIDYVDGVSLDQELRRGEDSSGSLSIERLIEVGRASAKILSALHACGIVFRDFKPGNLICTPAGGYRLVNFGVAWEEGSGAPPLEACTPEYCSPEQYAGSPPSRADDIFSWGAVLHRLASGGREASDGDADQFLRPLRREPLAELRPDLPAPLSAVVDRAVAWEPEQRYASMADLLEDFKAATRQHSSPAQPRDETQVRHDSRLPSVELAQSPLDLAVEVGDALCRAAVEEAGGVCWPTRSDFTPSSRSGPDLYDGAAGIALFLAELAQATGEVRYAETARGAVRWLMGPVWGHGRARPGLQCGEAGIGYLAIRLASLLDEPNYIVAAELRARRMAGVPFETLDLLYGAAGAAVFLTRLAACSNQYLAQANEAGDLLLRTARPAPAGAGCYWDVPGSDPSLPAMPYLGLAHGVAGIGFALVELADATGQERYLEAARSAADLLLTQAQPDGDGGLRWRRSLYDPEADLQAHCHGAIGIGQFFIRVAQLVPDQRYLDAARGAATTAGAQMASVRQSGLCHGLAGSGAYLLDCYRTFHDEQYLRQAQQCGQMLQHFRVADEAGTYRMSAAGVVSPDLMLGYGGIGSFYLRLSEPTRELDLILG